MTSPPRDPDIAELARLDAEIASLSLSVQTARAALEMSSTRLAQVRHQRATVAARLQDRYLAAAAAQAHAAAQAPALDAIRHAKHETSPRTIQTLLFILGGILLGSAAVVFTTVAWANVGVAGKAVILAGFTVLTLLVPPVVSRRSLHGTAETFAALGLLLVLLDGYAAWYVNLAGLADSLTAAEYTGAVFAVTSALAATYRAACRTLVGSRFIAIIAAQPVLPLLWADRGLGSAGWAVLLAAVAAADMAAVRYVGFTGGPARFGRQLVAGGCAGVALLVATQLALFGLVPADTVPAAMRAGGAVVIVFGVLLGAAISLNTPPLAQIAGGVAVVAVSAAALRLLTVPWPSEMPVLAAVVALVATGVVTALPSRIRRGPWAGALFVSGAVSTVAAGAVAIGALVIAGSALPFWRPSPSVETSATFTWQLPAVVALSVGSLAVLLGRGALSTLAVALAGALALAVPASGSWPWWVPLVADLLAGAGCAVTAARAGRARDAAVRSAAALVLIGHAFLTGLARPAGTAGVCAVLVGLAVAVAALGLHRRPGRIVGAGAGVIGVLAVPVLGAAVARLIAGQAPLRLWMPGRLPAAEVGALVGLAVTVGIVAALARLVPQYAKACAVGVAFAGLGVVVGAVAVTTGGLFGPICAIEVLCVVTVALMAVRPTPRTGEHRGALTAMSIAGGLSAVGAVLSVVPGAVVVLILPYGWLDGIWSGAPRGVGFSPDGSVDFGGDLSPAVATCAVLAVVCFIAFIEFIALKRHARVLAALLPTSPLVVLAVLMGCVAGGAPWPTLPVITLAAGLGWAYVVTCRNVTAVPGGWIALAAVTAGAGLSGCLPTRLMTQLGLGAVVVTAAVCGAVGRSAVARAAGWSVAVGSAGVLAFAAARAAGVGTWWSGYWVLLVAAGALALSAALAARPRPENSAVETTAGQTEAGRVEAVAAETAAHVTAGVALLLTIGSAGHAAGICTLWGIGLGLRVLYPRSEPGPRQVRVAAALACGLVSCWLLLVAGHVAVLEAYTAPAAAVATLGGWLAARQRAALGSWAAYGPALIAGIAPSLASVLVGGDGAPLRRLALGVVGVGLVLAGAAARLRAPVVVGGVTAAVVALHETLLLLDLIPRWIPLLAGGAVLVAVATTYERRRRDLARLRAAVSGLR